jgi:hypothetical protein
LQGAKQLYQGDKRRLLPLLKSNQGGSVDTGFRSKLLLGFILPEPMMANEVTHHPEKGNIASCVGSHVGILHHYTIK